jgi:uncharacterized protein YaeQ
MQFATQSPKVDPHRSETMNVMMLRALTWATVAAAVISALLLAWIE